MKIKDGKSGGRAESRITGCHASCSTARLNVFKKMETEGVSKENLHSIIVKMRETVCSANMGNPNERKSASFTPFSSLSLPVEATSPGSLY